MLQLTGSVLCVFNKEFRLLSNSPVCSANTFRTCRYNRKKHQLLLFCFPEQWYLFCFPRNLGQREASLRELSGGEAAERRRSGETKYRERNIIFADKITELNNMKNSKLKNLLTPFLTFFKVCIAKKPLHFLRSAMCGLRECANYRTAY